MVLALLLWGFFTETGLCQHKKIQDLAGRWDIVGEGNYGLIILDSSSLYLTYGDERKDILDYTIDFSKSPYWFDFSIRDTAAVMHVKSLLEIVNDSMIKWQLFVDEERSDHFTSAKGELYYLKKTGQKQQVSLTHF